MSARRGWFGKLLLPERADRRSPEQFAAYRLSDGAVKAELIRNISATGAYLVTNDRFHIGTHLLMTMQQEGPLEMNPDRRITAMGRVVRNGEDGVGLQFIPSKDPQVLRWAGLVENLVQQTQPNEMRQFLRLTAGITFLGQVCPASFEEMERLLRGKLNNQKVENISAIAVAAQSLVPPEVTAGKSTVDQNVLNRILENGSSAEEDWLQTAWGGLLAAFCAARPEDNLHPAMVALFCHLTAYQIRILISVCSRSPKTRSEDGLIVSQPLRCTLEEFSAITGARDVQINQDILRLADLKLIELAKESLLLTGHDDLTPTRLGLEMYIRCQGHRGSIEEFFASAV